MSSSTSITSPFLNLPSELRNLIYSHLLIHPLDTVSTVEEEYWRDKTRSTPALRDRFCANILQTCRQINREATPILYGENLFQGHSSLLATFPAMVVMLRPQHLVLPAIPHTLHNDKIRRYHINIRLDTDPRFSAQRAEESFTGAHELQVQVFQAMFGSSDYTVLHMLAGIRGVKKVRIYGSIGDGKYTSWLSQAMMAPVGTVIPAYDEELPAGVGWNTWTHGNR